MKNYKSKITKTIATLGMGVILATGLGLAATSNANAGNIGVGNIGINIHMSNGLGIYMNGRGHNYRQPHNRGYFNPGYYPPKRYRPKKHRRNYYSNPPRQAICNPRRAVNKAYRLGLNNPQVERVRERRVVVSGYQYGYRTKMVFKRYSKCKLIKTVRFN
ncbi:MAG: hypothetical protein L3J32_06655 [Rhizobiaceae bacterium]|nr:hypothetical protein [Rhizobiaceae bacterium]